MTHLMAFTKCQQKRIEMLITVWQAIDLETEDKNNKLGKC